MRLRRRSDDPRPHMEMRRLHGSMEAGQMNCPHCAHGPHKAGKCSEKCGNPDEPSFLHTRCKCAFAAPSKRAPKAGGLLEAAGEAEITPKKGE